MKRTLIRHKSKKYPVAPRSVEGVRETFMKPDIFEEYGLNKERDADFYIGTICHVGDEEDGNDKDYAFTVFASKYVIDFIKKMPPHQRSYLMDGTFDSLPSEYYQLLTISIEYKTEVSNSVLILSPVHPFYRPSVRHG